MHGGLAQQMVLRNAEQGNCIARNDNTTSDIGGTNNPGMNSSLPPPWMSTAATVAAATTTISPILHPHHSINLSDASLSPPHTPPNSSPGTAADSHAFQAALLKAADHYRCGDYLATINACQQLHTIDPTKSDVLLLLGAAYYQLKDYSRCIAANDGAILQNPSCAEAYANLGNALYQRGSIDLAITYLSSAVCLKSDFTDAYVNLAVAYILRGLPLPAAQAYSAALALNPELTAVRCSLGDLWRAYGDTGRAASEKCYSVALQTDPRCAAAWRGLGDCAQEIGELEKAVKNYKKAIEIDPALAEAYAGLGICFRDLKQSEESEKAFAVTSTLRPHCPLTMGNLAGAYYDNRKLDASVSAYRRAIALNPNFSEAFNNLGNALREIGRPHEAVDCYLSCIRTQLTTFSAATASASAYASSAAIDPGTPGRLVPPVIPLASAPPGSAAVVATAMAAQRLSISYNNLGGVLKLVGRNAECIAAYEHVVKLQPTIPEGHTNLGSAQKDIGLHEQALLSYKTALTIRPDFPEAFANLVHSMQCICDWRGRDVLFTRLEKEIERDLAIGKLPSVQPFHALTYPFSPSLVLQISQRYAEECRDTVKKMHDAPTEPLFLTCNPSYVSALASLPSGSTSPQQKQRLQPPPRRLRVGYVSSDFVNHPLAHLMGSVFGLHDRSKIEIFCYSTSPSDGSEFYQRISVEAENFLDASSWK